MWCHLKSTKMRSQLHFLMFTGHNNHRFYWPQLVRCVQLAWIPDENNLTHQSKAFQMQWIGVTFLLFGFPRRSYRYRSALWRLRPFLFFSFFSALRSHHRVPYWCLHTPPLRSLFHLVGVCALRRECVLRMRWISVFTLLVLVFPPCGCLSLPMFEVGCQSL